MLVVHGLIISKIMYCIYTWASYPGYLKKRLQEIMNKTVRIVYGSRTKSLKEQFRELDWFTLEDWINYMDILTGKTIGDFSQPQDIAGSMGLEFGPRARVRHCTGPSKTSESQEPC